MPEQLKVLITGARGMVATALRPRLAAEGHELRLLSRGSKLDEDSGERHVSWDPEQGYLDASRLEGLDAVIHLASSSLAQGRWNEARKREIRDSRVLGTRLLMQRLAQVQRPPRVVISASATGYYGDTGEILTTEQSAAGHGFLADVCCEWEYEAARAERFAARLVLLRIGVVLSGAGGALARMLPAFRLGVGGRLGSGRQWMSWIAIDDLCRVILACLADRRLEGPVNAVAPVPVRNAHFTAALARALARPAVVPIPAVGLRLVFGEMARETLLASSRVLPARLDAVGHSFSFPEAEAALRHVLGRSAEEVNA